MSAASSQSQSRSADQQRPRCEDKVAHGETGFGQRWVAALQTLIFFAAFFFCLLKWIDVELIYHGGGVVKGFPVFFWGWEFASETLRYPGGLADYSSALLAQALYAPWWGSFLITLQAWIILESARRLLEAVGSGAFSLTAFALPLLVLSVYARYGHMSEPISSLALAALAIAVYLKLPEAQTKIRVAGLVVLTSVVYAATVRGLLAFGATLFLFELRKRSTWRFALLVLAWSTMVPFAVGCGIYGLGIGEAYHQILPPHWRSEGISKLNIFTLWGLSGLLPTLVACGLGWKSFILPRLAARRANSEKSNSGAEKTREASRSSDPARRERTGSDFPTVPALQGAALALAAIAVVYSIHEPKLKAFLKVDYHIWRQEWDQALASAPDFPRSAYLESALAQASCHTGGLTRALPRALSADQLLLTQEGPEAYWRRSDLYYDLGYLNMALHLLVEGGEFLGQRPMLLRRLALVNAALGNVDTSMIHFKALLKVPFHRDWARSYLSKLETDATLKDDPEVSRLRSLTLKDDSVVKASGVEELTALLAANPQNRPAFELLMTHHLLVKDLASFVRDLPGIKGFAGFSVPPLWDEALVLASQSKQPLDLRGFVPSAEGRRRFDKMREILRACGGDMKLAGAKLQQDYGASYFFYYVFRS